MVDKKNSYELICYNTDDSGMPVLVENPVEGQRWNDQNWSNGKTPVSEPQESG